MRFAIHARPHLLVIDEVGRQFGTDAEKAQSEELLGMRPKKNCRHSFAPSVDKSQLPNFPGERGFDRLRENGGIMAVCDWTRHRGAQAN